MVFGKLRSIFSGLRKRHPDVYKALKRYCDEKGINMSDVAAAALASYLAADDEGKEELERAMAERSVGHSTGVPNVKATIGLVKELCDAMGSMFRAVNEARANVATQSMLADFKAMANFLNEVKEASSESGRGSVEDMLAGLLFSRLFGGGIGSKAKKIKTGTGKVKEVSE